MFVALTFVLVLRGVVLANMSFNVARSASMGSFARYRSYVELTCEFYKIS